MWLEHLLFVHEALGSIPSIGIRHSGTCCLVSWKWRPESLNPGGALGYTAKQAKLETGPGNRMYGLNKSYADVGVCKVILELRIHFLIISDRRPSSSTVAQSLRAAMRENGAQW